MKTFATPKEAISSIQSGNHIFIHGAAATPLPLIDALTEAVPRLENLEIFHMHTSGKASYADQKFQERVKTNSFFLGGNLRSRFKPGSVDYIPCFLSEIPHLLRSRIVPIDVALIHVSPPDRHGYCTLGTSVDIARAAVESAKIIIAQINPKMPKVHGDGLIHIDQIHYAIEVDEYLPAQNKSIPTPEESAIAKYCASMIEDGSTLQMGIGSIPDAVLAALSGHKNMGIHTEMWSDGALQLIQSGVVDNSRKKIHPGKTVSGFVSGTQALYDFIHDNPSTVLLDIGYVNNPANICKNPQVVAINSAVEIDLTGQVCADSIGSKIISGAGGQMDFIRGASLSAKGKPIIALTSRTKNGATRIVPTLKTGAGVVTTRAHVHYVVTEYGIADLYGKSLDQRAKAMIKIAHPEDRDHLSKQWQELFS